MHANLISPNLKSNRKTVRRANVRSGVEQLEARFPLDGDTLHVGLIYIESDVGSDKQGDRFELTFSGGAANTQLTSVTLDSNLEQASFGVGDNLFDTIEFGAPGDRYGADHAFAFKVISQAGIQQVTAHVDDGSPVLRIDFVGFEAGDRLVFSIDVDEVEEFDPAETNPLKIQEGIDPITSGVEFQGTKLAADFTAPNYHPVTSHSVFRNKYDDALHASGLDLPEDDKDGLRDRSAGAFGDAVQVPLPISLAGNVFEDLDLDLQRDAGEPLLQDVVLQLWKRNDQGSYTNTGLTTKTNGAGHYEFGTTLNLLPGEYQVREVQPAGYLSVGAIPGRRSDGQVAGARDASDLNLLTQVQIPLGGMSVVDLDFAEARPAQLSGYVFYDPNQDVIQQANEPGIPGSRIRIIPIHTIDPRQGIVELTTDSQGNFVASGLAPGEYKIIQVVQPAGYFDSSDAAGTVNGQRVGTAVNPGDEINGVRLASGQAGIQYRFGEIRAASLSGHVHASKPNGDCYEDESQAPPLANVLIELFNAVTNERIAETRTDANGAYAFTGLRPGSFRVVEHTPAGWLDGDDHVGSVDGKPVGTVSENDVLDRIALGSGANGIDYDFCEVQPANLRGFVFHDLDNDGVRDNGEPGISQVQVGLYNTAGAVVATIVTDSTGAYSFSHLRPGVYSVREVQPAGWLDGKEQLGTVSGQSRGEISALGDRFDAVLLEANESGIEYNFGELLPIQLTGNVHLVDKNGDCFSDNVFHEPVAGAAIRLFDLNGNLVKQTVTDAHGDYEFRDLKPGTYRVVETTPDGLIDGGARVGEVNGVVVGQIIDSGTVANIKLFSGSQAIHYDFCESLPARISGTVYHDEDLDGHRTVTEPGIAEVRIELRNASGGLVATTQTDSQGRYLFEGLVMGTYQIREIQPAGWWDGLESLGTIDGVTVGLHAVNDQFDQLVLPSDGLGQNYDFGEYLPVTISGLVHSDPDHDCIVDPGELRLSGVRIELWLADRLVASTMTDDKGEYQFQNLAPGTYTIREIQPTGYFQGGQVAGSAGGNVDVEDVISQVTARSGEHLVDYHFCEIPPSELSGYVFQDGGAIQLGRNESLPENIAEVRDGKRTSDDTPLAGVVLELRDGRTGRPIPSNVALPNFYQSATIRVTTDAQGHYHFTGLPRGNYAVYEIQPEGFLDGVDTPGSTDGIPVNAGQPVSPSVLASLEEEPNNDAILRIALPAGVHSQDNNFSEIRVNRPEPFVPFVPPVPASIPPAIDLALTELEAAPPPQLIVPLVNPVRPIRPARRAFGYTWHLSVTNAGYPRESSMTQSTEHRQGAPVWLPVDYARRGSDAEWSLYVVDEKPRRLRKLQFGDQHAIPIAGDFNGDGSAEIGVFDRGHWLIDLNGNGEWDNADLWARLGYAEDLPVVGDWDGDGKDDIGIFGRAWPGDPRAVAAEPGLPDGDNQQETRPKNLPPDAAQAARGRRELQATATGPVRTDVIDHVFHYGVVGDAPVTGDWNGDGIHSIGIFRAGTWRLDVNGDGQWSSVDRAVQFGSADDIPLAGDWNGDGIDEIGVFRAGTFYLDRNANDILDGDDAVIETDSPQGRPIVGDWNGDGKDDVGVQSTPQAPRMREARRTAS